MQQETEFVVSSPCSGTLYLSLVASALRSHIYKENTSLELPKPTSENGLPDFCLDESSEMSGIRIEYVRCECGDDDIEHKLVCLNANIKKSINDQGGIERLGLHCAPFSGWS